MHFARRAVTIAVLASACRGTDRVTPSAALDDFGDTVAVAPAATRIVSLSPVSTEALFAIGAGANVVGRTHWDTYPAAARAVADLGNGMQPNVEAILGVHPDLVVLYASAGNRAAAQQLRRAGVRTLSLHMDHVGDFRHVVAWLGRVTGDSAAGAAVVDSVERSIADVAKLPRPTPPPTVFWHVWDTPLITIGAGSYLNELVVAAGARNVFADMADASPQVSMEELVRRDPDYIIAGATSAPAIRANPAWQSLRAVRLGHVVVADTALVGRPGVRMGEAARHLRALLVPDATR